LYANATEALDENLNKKYYQDFVTVWRSRYVQTKTPQIIITGTLWSPTDFLAKVTALWENESKFTKDPKFKYTKISKDGKKVIIKVPALDYETGESTCPKVKSTARLLQEKASMSTYLWETNFQQNPTSPEGLYFDWTNLKTYERLPIKETDVCYASLDPSRTGNDYVSMPIFNQIGEEHYLIDIVFDNKAVNSLIDTFANAIIRNHVTVLVVEINTNTSLPEMIYKKLAEKSYYEIKIIEKYNEKKKEMRINEFKDVILRKIVFPAKHLYGTGTPMGKAMEQMTSYSFEYPNRHDDMIDSVAMYADQIIEENGLEQKVIPFKRPF
jgi:predicted phage terminase large subunit-like protein